MSGKLEDLRRAAEWHLTQHTVPEYISDAYSHIEINKVKKLFGNENLQQALAGQNLLDSMNGDAAGFVQVNARAAQTEQFALDQQRVKNVTQVIQFLERQKYDVNDVATQAIAEEDRLNNQKVQGKAK